MLEKEPNTALIITTNVNAVPIETEYALAEGKTFKIKPLLK